MDFSDRIEFVAQMIRFEYHRAIIIDVKDVQSNFDVEAFPGLQFVI